MTKATNLAPDETLVRLAQLVNAKLSDGARVNFHRIKNPNGSERPVAVFQYGGNSHVEVFDVVLVEDDVDLIVRKIEEWAERHRSASKWTEDQVEADSLDWNR